MIQIGRTTFAVAASAGNRPHAHFVNALVWEVATAPIWIAGIAVDGNPQLAVAFTGTVALWWCYFHRAEGIGLKAVEGFMLAQLGYSCAGGSGAPCHARDPRLRHHAESELHKRGIS